jgi:hypothetical protein
VPAVGAVVVVLAVLADRPCLTVFLLLPVVVVVTATARFPAVAAVVVVAPLVTGVQGGTMGLLVLVEPEF